MRGVKGMRDGSRTVWVTVVEAAVAGRERSGAGVAAVCGQPLVASGAPRAWGRGVRARSGSGERGERSGACERGDERVGPGLGGVDA
jgi:hypothetical protein